MEIYTLQTVVFTLAVAFFVFAVWNYGVTKRKPLAGQDVPEDYTDQWLRFKLALANTPIKSPPFFRDLHFDLAQACKGASITKEPSIIQEDDHEVS